MVPQTSRYDQPVKASVVNFQTARRRGEGTSCRGDDDFPEVFIVQVDTASRNAGSLTPLLCMELQVEPNQSAIRYIMQMIHPYMSIHLIHPVQYHCSNSGLHSVSGKGIRSVRLAYFNGQDF